MRTPFAAKAAHEGPGGPNVVESVARVDIDASGAISVNGLAAPLDEDVERLVKPVGGVP